MKILAFIAGAIACVGLALVALTGITALDYMLRQRRNRSSIAIVNDD